jgi:hypothetical protein
MITLDVAVEYAGLRNSTETQLKHTCLVTYFSSEVMDCS